MLYAICIERRIYRRMAFLAVFYSYGSKDLSEDGFFALCYSYGKVDLLEDGFSYCMLFL